MPDLRGAPTNLTVVDLIRILNLSSLKNRYAALPDDQEGSYANYSFNAVGANDAEEAAKPPPTVKASFKEAPVAKPSVKISSKPKKLL